MAIEALTISRKIHYTLGEGYALQNLGLANALMGKRLEAEMFLNQADAIAKKTGDQKLAAYVLLRMGQNNQGNDNKKALYYELKAVETAQKTGNKALLSLCQRRVNEKKKQQSDYDPTVYVTTKKISNAIEIIVADNGNGIPQKILDKIFQPFFTTKPTGNGTGLGLSLAYDIVKAHGGEIKVETTEGEGSEFVIILPKT
jgi:light-regulated signal transduction histidine kinase (bacteriophytochrome)